MEDESYQIRYRRMVAKVGENLTEDNCYMMSYIHCDSIPQPFYESHSKNGLKLLQKMENNNDFSSGKPEKLAAIMERLRFMELKNIVDNFISKLKLGYVMAGHGIG